MDFFEFSDKHNLNFVITRSAGEKLYFCNFEHTVTKGQKMRFGITVDDKEIIKDRKLYFGVVVGAGKTTKKAINDYISLIQGKTLIHCLTNKRIIVPKNLKFNE